MTDSIPIHPKPTAMENTIDRLIIKVDRLNQAAKLMKWVATGAVGLALSSLAVVIKIAYGFGSSDATTHAAVERAQRELDEVKSQVRELQKTLYTPHTYTYSASPSGAPAQPLPVQSVSGKGSQ